MIAEFKGDDVGGNGEESVVMTGLCDGRRGVSAMRRSWYNDLMRGNWQEGSGFESDSMA
jgi:hypothetical protein